MRYIGDSQTAIGAKEYERRLTLEEAQTMTDLICDAVGWTAPIVMFDNATTKSLNGRINTRKGWMKLYHSGLTEGTVLHELAHKYKPPQATSHGCHFKWAQQMLYLVWRGAVLRENEIDALRRFEARQKVANGDLEKAIDDVFSDL
jgi:hypothetical protein